MKNLNNFFLGEGNTPLIRLFNLEERFNWRGQLWAKCEYQNPTGSFKDRGSIVEISAALKQKRQGVVCASTGNMAASLSAYATRAKIPCLVVIPKQTPAGKIRQATIHGAKLIEVDGNYDTCVVKAKALAKEKNLLLCGDYGLRRYGQQTLGEELARSSIQFSAQGGPAFGWDAFIVPVGNGTLGCAISEGFAKFNQYPKFIGVSGSRADPLYQAWKSSPSIIRIIERPQTIATAMSVGNPLDGKLTLTWVKKTQGQLFSVSDNEILSAQKLLAQIEGIFVETAAAATVAILGKRKNKTQTMVLILTGNGLKEN